MKELKQEQKRERAVTDRLHLDLERVLERMNKMESLNEQLHADLRRINSDHAWILSGEIVNCILKQGVLYAKNQGEEAPTTLAEAIKFLPDDAQEALDWNPAAERIYNNFYRRRNTVAHPFNRRDYPDAEACITVFNRAISDKASRSRFAKAVEALSLLGFFSM
jgi:hypothetical protein